MINKKRKFIDLKIYNLLISQKQTYLNYLSTMQAIGGGLGRGGNQGEPVNPGGSGSSKAQYSVDKADNINPHAPDCYFYYYSNCSKVCL